MLAINGERIVCVRTDFKIALSSILASKPKLVLLAAAQRDIRHCLLTNGGKLPIEWVPRKENKADRMRRGGFMDKGITRDLTKTTNRTEKRHLNG